MKFSPKCRTKKFGIIYTILGSFCSFLNWEGAVIWPQIRPRKIAEVSLLVWINCVDDNVDPNQLASSEAS